VGVVGVVRVAGTGSFIPEWLCTGVSDHWYVVQRMMEYKIRLRVERPSPAELVAIFIKQNLSEVSENASESVRSLRECKRVSGLRTESRQDCGPAARADQRCRTTYALHPFKYHTDLNAIAKLPLEHGPRSNCCHSCLVHVSTWITTG